MTTFNTDYNNTELLDQELNLDELQGVNGGILGPMIAGISIFLLGQKPPIGHTVDTVLDAADGTIGTKESRVYKTKEAFKEAGVAPFAN